jgi:O-antigen ligase
LGPHNFYLLTLAERGAVGLATFLALLLLLLVRGVRTAITAPDPRLRAAAVGLSGGLLFMAAHAMVGDLFVGSMGPPAAALMALLAAATCARCSMAAEPAGDTRAAGAS